MASRRQEAEPEEPDDESTEDEPQAPEGGDKPWREQMQYADPDA